MIAYLLQFTPGIAISVLAFMAFGICLYAWNRYRDFPAFGYLYVTLYFAVLYGILFIFQPADETRRFFVRIGVIGLLVDIIIWRIDFIRRERKKHGR